MSAVAMFVINCYLFLRLIAVMSVVSVLYKLVLILEADIVNVCCLYSYTNCFL